jgi:excisionase family DNA binding protein
MLRCPSLPPLITLYDALPYAAQRCSVLCMTQRPTDDGEPLVFLEEAAAILGIGKDTVRRLSADGTIPFVKIGPNARRRYDPAVLRRIRAEASEPSEPSQIGA